MTYLKSHGLSRRKADTSIMRRRSKCIRKFQFYFPGGFTGKKYMAWEREYKWNAHLSWQEKLNKEEFANLLKVRAYEEIARRAVTLESKTNLLFSFEKMALRDAVKDKEAAKLFAEGLFEYIYGEKNLPERFENFLFSEFVQWFAADAMNDFAEQLEVDVAVTKRCSRRGGRLFGEGESDASFVTAPQFGQGEVRT